MPSKGDWWGLELRRKLHPGTWYHGEIGVLHGGYLALLRGFQAALTRLPLLRNQILYRILECPDNHMLMCTLPLPVTSQLHKAKSRYNEHYKKQFCIIKLFPWFISMLCCCFFVVFVV